MRRLARVGFTLVLAMSLPGCWLLPGVSPDRTYYNPAEDTLTPGTVGDAEELWRHDFPLQGDQVNVSVPVVSPGQVHLVVERPEMGCTVATSFGADDGAVTGFTPISDSCIDSGPGFWFNTQASDPHVIWADGRLQVVAGSTRSRMSTTAIRYEIAEGRSVAFDPETGDIIEGTATPETVIGAARDDVTAGTFRHPRFINFSQRPARIDATVHDPATGSDTLPISYGSLDQGLTLGLDGTLYVTGSGPLGTEPGDLTMGGAVRAFSLDAGTGCGSDGRGTDGQLACPDWVYPTSPPSPGTTAAAPTLSVEGDSLLWRDGDTLHVLDPTDGTAKWTLPARSNPTVVTPDVGSDPTLIVVTPEGQMQGFDMTACDAGQCEPSWSAEVASAAGAKVAVAGEVIYVASGGVIEAFSLPACAAGECAALWSAPGSGAFAVTGGKVFTLNPERTALIAYGLPDL